MEVLHRRCAGLDVHKQTVVACVRVQRGSINLETKSFGATVSELSRLSEWLKECKCTHVAMEATGVYWKPVWHMLEDDFELILANAREVKNLPGRKTDVRDAEWLSELLAHGLIRASFVPPRPIAQLRDLTRTRKQLVRQVVQHTHRIAKALEAANIRLNTVLTDILGTTGRAMLDALARGETDPERLLQYKQRGVKASDQEFVEALRGKLQDHHRFLIRLHLGQIDATRADIEHIDQQIEEALDPFRDKVKRLIQIPGVSDVLAGTIIAEIGVDMTRFPTAAHVRSWAGLCPRNDSTGGKKRSTRTLKGNTWLKTQLVQAATAVVRAKNTYFQAQYFRIRARRGHKKAVVAVAASILTAAYHILRDDVDFAELGPEHLQRRNPEKAARSLVRRLKSLGFKVTVEPAA
jgi:transposase